MKEGIPFYRCTLCKRVVSLWDISKNGGCKNCGSTRLGTTNLTLLEKIVQIVKHPKIWEWEHKFDGMNHGEGYE